MTFAKSIRVLRPSAAVVALLAVALPLLQACSATEKLLEATDPDLIIPGNVESAAGADAVRIGTLARWRSATAAGGDFGTYLFSGLLADEWATSSTFIQNDEVDQRNIRTNNSAITQIFRDNARVRTAANQAIRLLTEFSPTQAVQIAEMYLARGFAEMQLASDFCNGIPLSDAAGDAIVFGEPRPVADVFRTAIASFDSGLALATGSATEAVRIQNALKIGKARAQLGVNLVAEAAATVAGVPTTYRYDMTFLAASGSNQIWSQNPSSRRFSLGDSIEGRARNILVRNHIPFFTARDPRVPGTYTIGGTPTKPDTTLSQDGGTLSRTTSLWGRESPVAIAAGVDARLIEAEARWKANDIPGMMTILNALRSAPPVIGGSLTPSGLAPLATPASPDAALDLLFREKAFWTFSRGQRLGDLRRLIRFYGRTEENTFPSGPHFRGGTYGDDVNFPVPQEEESGNPSFKGCLDRNA